MKFSIQASNVAKKKDFTYEFSLSDAVIIATTVTLVGSIALVKIAKDYKPLLKRG
ncbi:hypothetical protein [Streptococcus sp. DD12]|uniref:hypothetical protein n=1 Tax=Streptococcus sp. DD12 TaxID=1777880 RepID=UPI00079BE341|nr:hypothetical protein [Streptococcus sp. DD12]KXT75308.1 hypothetical protein STRDD12_01429 [Streptococcus sp. DD12]